MSRWYFDIPTLKLTHRRTLPTPSAPPACPKCFGLPSTAPSPATTGPASPPFRPSSSTSGSAGRSPLTSCLTSPCRYFQRPQPRAVSGKVTRGVNDPITRSLQYCSTRTYRPKTVPYPMLQLTCSCNVNISAISTLLLNCHFGIVSIKTLTSAQRKVPFYDLVTLCENLS